jgi:serine/threonine protein kinase
VNFFPNEASNFTKTGLPPRFELIMRVLRVAPRHMDNKIFLGKYRVSVQEIEAVGECAGSPLAYEAQEIASGKKVVVELIPAEGLKTAEREQLAAEANAAKKIKHVNIPTLYDFGVEQDYLVYVTEDFDGTLAEEWVNTHGPLAVGPVLRIASQVVSALGAAAFHQIVHRAINPGNLVFVASQTADRDWPLVKVLHFGGFAPTLSDTGGPVATFDKSLHYASPEQIQNGTVDFPSEIYSLGCTMWFLLTGVPPLVAPKESFAVASTAPGGKANAIPKKVRRLLAEMLSTNPEGRPHNPLEFYRKLQDCLVQVERREAMSRRFGVPSFSRSSAGMPGSRRIPAKMLALAALLLTIATIAALVVPGYLRHRRIVRAEEPIGVPVGVPSPVASAAPAAADATNAVASNQTQTSSVVAPSNSSPSAATRRVEPDSANALPPATNPAESTNRNQVAIQPAEPPGANSQANSQAQQPPPVAANSTNTIAESAEVASLPRAAASQPRTQSPDKAAQQTARKKLAVREVRRAEPVEPEVRRAEPAPPAEGPAATAPETTASSERQTDSPLQIERNHDAEAETAQKPSHTEKHTDSEPKVAARPRTKSERRRRPKRWVDEEIYRPQQMPESEEAMPRRSFRARFVGVTPDGMWMFRLPSNKIVIVPPPQRGVSPKY